MVDKKLETGSTKRAQEHEIGWVLIPPAIACAKDLNAAQKILWGRIYGLVGTNGYCWAGNSWLGEQLGMNPRTVEGHISALVSKGYLRREWGAAGKRTRRLYPVIPSRETTGSHPAESREAIPQNHGKYKSSIDKDSNRDDSKTSSRPIRRPQLEEDAQEIREYLNKQCSRRFPPDSGQMKYIRARLKEGKPKEHLKLIVDYFAQEWGDDDRMRVYLRPATLFSKEHYDEYYERALEWKEKGRPPKRNGNGQRLSNAARIEEDLNQAVARLCGRGT